MVRVHKTNAQVKIDIYSLIFITLKRTSMAR